MKSRLIPTLFVLALSGLTAPPARSDEAKYHNKDLILDEARVPAYDLPPILVSSEGQPITTADEWFRVRRPQILALFGNLVYGVVPGPESPIRTTFEVVRTNGAFLDGRATRKDVRRPYDSKTPRAPRR